jgi:hypothetical protein
MFLAARTITERSFLPAVRREAQEANNDPVMTKQTTENNLLFLFIF